MITAQSDQTSWLFSVALEDRLSRKKDSGTEILQVSDLSMHHVVRESAVSIEQKPQIFLIWSAQSMAVKLKPASIKVRANAPARVHIKYREYRIAYVLTLTSSEHHWESGNVTFSIVHTSTTLTSFSLVLVFF